MEGTSEGLKSKNACSASKINPTPSVLIFIFFSIFNGKKGADFFQKIKGFCRMEIWRTHNGKNENKRVFGCLLCVNRDACPLPGAGEHILLHFSKTREDTRYAILGVCVWK